MKRTQAGVAIVALGFLILVVLASGVVGVAVHHGDRHPPANLAAHVAGNGAGPGKTGTTVVGTTTTVTTIPAAPVTPAGFTRVTDTIDHVSVALPSGWRTPVLTAGQTSEQLKAYAVQNPQLSPLIDAALSAVAKIDLGVFAADPTTRRVLYVYGIEVPAGVVVDDIPTSEVVSALAALGAKNIQTSQVQLPVGKADRVSLQLLVKGVTVSELVDFFVLGRRLVYAVLARPGVRADTDLFKQIQQTLQPAA